MSKEISSTIDDVKLQPDDKTTTNKPINCNTDDSGMSKTLETNTEDKTPIPASTTLIELSKDENLDPLAIPLANENLENTKLTQGLNETECVKFAEKLYKVFSIDLTIAKRQVLNFEEIVYKKVFNGTDCTTKILSLYAILNLLCCAIYIVYSCMSTILFRTVTLGQ